MVGNADNVRVFAVLDVLRNVISHVVQVVNIVVMLIVYIHAPKSVEPAVPFAILV